MRSGRGKMFLAAAVIAAMMVSCGGTKTGESTESSGSSTAGSSVSSTEESPAGSSSTTNSTENSSVTDPEVTPADESGNKDDSQVKEVGPEVLSLSAPSGAYDGEFDLEILSSDDKYTEIYYTLDGSDPIGSATAAKYENSVKIEDRSGEPNVVSAVDPTLFCANFSKVNSAKTGFECTLSAPDDDAVDKCTVVRAVAKDASGKYSAEINAVYFIGTMEDHIEGLAESVNAAGIPLAVISLQMNYDDLFDSEYGIYVKGDIYKAAEEALFKKSKHPDPEDGRKMAANYREKGREWEREAGMTMLEFNADGTSEVVLSQNCGVRVQGNYSRSDLTKGLRLYARKDYGKKNFKYAVFGDEYVNDDGKIMEKFKTLTLRAGGNCAFSAKFNDTYWQSLLYDFTTETQRSRPCVVYLNGEYWGLFVLQENYNDDYFEELHGLNKDDIIVYKGDAEALEMGYKLDEGELPEGVTRENYYFTELLDFFDEHENLSDQADYEEFTKLVDPKSLMEYFAVEVWIDNKWDWPGKNWSMWKTKADDGSEYGDGRWRFLFYDVEFGGFSGNGDIRHNTIKEDNYKPKGLLDFGTDNPAVLCFAYMMTNAGARSEFEDLLVSLSENEFETEAATEKLEWFEEVYGPLYAQFFERFPGAGKEEDAYGSIRNIKDFLKGRPANIDTMIKYIERTVK